MVEALIPHYLWLKAIHIISVITWMAGLLYLPRLYVYHTQVPVESDAYKIFKTMERRLLKVIINPSGIFAFITGLLLVAATGAGILGKGGWMHAKFLLVVGLGVLHGMLSRYRKDFVRGENKHSEKFYRILNEVPTVLMIAIILLVVLKPF